jgi:hypothetical protein
MDLQGLGRLLIVAGLIIAMLGIVLLVLARLPFLNGLGNLPGDIRIEGENSSCFVPVISMILLSVILTIVLNIIVRIINRP